MAVTGPEMETLVWRQFLEDRPPADKLDEWYALVGGDLSLDPKAVKSIVRRHSKSFRSDLAFESRTRAQEVAEELGAGMADAIAVLRDCLHAAKEKPVLNRQGEAVLNPKTGEPWVMKTPDWAVRKDAAVHMLKLHAAFPADKTEVTTKSLSVNLNLTDAELIEQFRELERDTRELRKALAATAGPARKRVGAAEGGAPGADGDAGCVLLPDALHEDEGRAG